MALGKGLGSLIPQKPQSSASAPTSTAASPRDDSQSILQLNPQEITVNPHQPRQQFNSRELEDLIESVRVHGIIQPLVVTRKQDGRYELIAGERRLRAAKTLDLPTVPAILRDAKEQEKLEIAIIENIQRKNLNAMEEAVAYERLMQEFNLNQEELAKRMGKSRSTVANTLRLLDLPDEVKDAVRNEQITEGHARAIAALPSISAQLQLLKKIVDNKITVREAEREAQSVKGFKRKAFDPVVLEYEEKLRDALGTRVSIKKKGSKGEIKLFFDSIDDFKDLINKLSKR